MNRAVACHPTQGFCRRPSSLYAQSAASRFRALLLLGVASGALSLSVGAAAAEDLTWGSTGPDEQPWETAGNWLSDGETALTTPPTAGDQVTIAAGYAGVSSIVAAVTVNIDAGALWINKNGVLNAETVNVAGGRLALRKGDAQNAQGVAKIATLLNITAGTVDRPGLIVVGDSGTVTQSGGTVTGAIQIQTPTYTQSGGRMEGIVTTSDYDLSGPLVDDEVSAQMAGIVRLDTLFTLSGDGALVTGEILGDGDATMTQSGGRMEGRADGLAGYTQTGGEMVGNITTGDYSISGGRMADGSVTFADLFAVSGNDTVLDWMYLIGSRDAVMTQSGGKMGAGVFSEALDGAAPGIARYSQSGGEMYGWVRTDAYDLSGGTLTGSVHFSDLFTLSGDGHVDWGTFVTGYGDAAVVQSGGVMESSELTGISSYSQSGGTMKSSFTVGKYTQSGGIITGAVSADIYELAGGIGEGFANVTIGSTLVQSGGTFDYDGIVVPTFTQSGGLFSGTISASTYNLTGASATSTGGVITASDSFNLAPQTGTAVVDALLLGTGGIVKSGNSTVRLTNAGNSFSGGVVIQAGTLDILNDALTDGAAIAINPDAILKLTTTANTVYTSAMTGQQGDLVKAGAAAATLTGNIDLGDLWLDAGRLNIGTGTTTNEAVFESATVAWGSTLYIAKNATLTIRKPKHLVNNGTLINDGTVHDDLDNTGTFSNNQTYNANVATNTGTINNNTPGFWTGNIATNAGTINNNAGSIWTGNVLGNTGLISNKPGGIWNGIVKGNTGGISNNGSWIGAVEMNGTLGVDTGLDWGKVIYNSITGTWAGDVKANSSWIVNAGGTWTGNIDTNNADIWNDNAADEVGTGYWVGDIVANSGRIFNGGGGNWEGDILSNAYYIKSDKGAVWTGDVLGNSYGIENRGVWTGDVVANGRALFNTGVWNGKVTGNSGLIINGDDIANDATDGTWNGDVAGNGGTGTIENRGGVWTGNVLANSGTITNAAGTLNNVATGDASWIGNVVSNAGTITNAAGSTWTGDVLANTGIITTAGVWTGSVAGAYSFSNAGTVNAQNRINAAFTNASGGLLHLTGSLAGITTLTNSGTIDMHGAGAAQTLTAASATFDSSSTLKFDVDVTGHSDKIVVTGTAVLGGTVYISGAQASGGADYTSPYEFLSAGTRTGTFLGVTTDLAFLTPTLTYDTDSAFVTLSRNGQSFTATGNTPNQKEVAASVDALGAGNAIYDAVLFLNEDEAQAAFDQLSGEAHTSLETASIESADLVGAVATGRIAQAFAKVDGEASASGYASEAVMAETAVGDNGFWTQFYGAVGIVASGSSSAGTNSMTGGAAMGLDGVLGDWRLGMMLHAGTTGTSVASLNSTSTSTDYGIGVYGGRQWGDTTLSLGVVYTRHDIRSKRDVTFPGFTNTVSGVYASGTTQVFGEVSHAFDLGTMTLTPYAGVAYVSHATDGFTETGGAASLTSSASVVDATFTTLGFSADRKFVVGDDMLLTATASLGWRHAFASAPGSTHTLTGGTSFATVGTPVVADMLMFGAGLNLDMSAYNALNLVYDGQAGATTQTHALTGTWSTRF